MGRFRLMTLGFFLILIGAQLYCVRSYLVTSKAAKFIKQRIIEVDDSATNGAAPQYSNSGYSNQYYGAAQAATTPAHEVTPPSWLKWAALFAGSVICLQGAAAPRQ